MSALLKFEEEKIEMASICSGEFTGLSSSTCLKANHLRFAMHSSGQKSDIMHENSILSGASTGLISSTCLTV